jgi:small conductance mechanosensitive channel
MTMGFDLTAALVSIQELAFGFVKQLPYFLIAIAVYAGFHLAARLARRVIKNLAGRRRRHVNVALVLGRLAEGGLMLMGVLVAMVIAIPSFKPGQLIQILGISGVAIGFAFRDILQNFLAGILILLTEPFRLGDQIVVGGFEGTVEEIETRATSIRTYDGRRVVIPNSNLFTQSVTVNTAFDKRRLQYDVTIGYGDDIGHAQRVMLGALGDVHGVMREPAPEALVTELAASGVTIRARWWINPPRRLDVVKSMSDALHAMKDALTVEGIDLPYMTQTILLHDQTDQTDGDRAQQREGWPAGKGPSPQPRSIAAVLQRRAEAGAPREKTAKPVPAGADGSRS